MPTLSNPEIAALLHPYYPHPTQLLLDQLSTYLDLLLKWNSRTNLTAIRDPQAIVRTHFGESLFVARHLPGISGPTLCRQQTEESVCSPPNPIAMRTLLDLGSGAGFPGLPIQLAFPDLRVTLAESQSKKASFLREVVRVLKLPTEVWGARVETLPPARLFDIVTLRAVDDPSLALKLAQARLTEPGIIAHLTSSDRPGPETIPIPGSATRVLHLITP